MIEWLGTLLGFCLAYGLGYFWGRKDGERKYSWQVEWRQRSLEDLRKENAKLYLRLAQYEDIKNIWEVNND